MLAETIDIGSGGGLIGLLVLILVICLIIYIVRRM
jgi:hypothetical protein